MNITAFYLPQFHEIPENNKWWGNGFTEWNNLKAGKKYYTDQYQPRIPLNNNYYDLLNIEVMKWQGQLARQYGIHSFCVYHYWFNGKMLLEKPMENLLNHPEIDFPFFFCWANEAWTTVWKGEDKVSTLIEPEYNDPEDWKNHYLYFSRFFHDKRYVIDNGKPIICIYHPLSIPYIQLKRMLACWRKMAKQDGYEDLVIIYENGMDMVFLPDFVKNLFDYGFEQYPGLVDWDNKKTKHKTRNYLLQQVYFDRIVGKILSILKKNSASDEKDNQRLPLAQNYDDVWGAVIKRVPSDKKTIPGAFVDWDNTGRRKENGKVILGAKPEKFKQYLKHQIIRAKDVYNKNMIALFAWNEWSEGGYLEPDEKYQYKYLEAIKDALIECDEWPNNDKPVI